MDLLGLIRAGDVDGFNAARERAGKVELFAEELAELKLVGIDLSGANVDKADLTGADLTEANLVHAHLCDIDGSGMVLDGVLGMRAKLRDAWLEEADLTGADFSGGDLSGAVLHRTKGEGIRLLGSKAKSIEAHDVHWPLADVSEASLKGADLTRANLSKIKATDAALHGATLTEARLDGADADGLQAREVQATGASFAGARLQRASFAGAVLDGADFSGADLRKVDFSGASLKGARFEAALLADAVLDDAVLDGAVFDEADLTGVDPVAIGLSEEAVAKLAAHGARFDPDAPIEFEDAEVAVRGGEIALVWLNPDAPDVATLRWAVHGPAGTRSGVMALSAAQVQFHTVVAVGEGFRVVALVDRADGPSAVTWPLSREAGLGRAKAVPLGYEPMVLPVVRATEDAVWMWGLARRGPTIAVHRDQLDGQGLVVVRSEPKPQAQGYLGRLHPVLLCKGRVVMAMQGATPGPPRGTPEGFPTRTSTAVPVGDRIIAAWVVPPMGRDPGGVRYQELGARTAREVEALSDWPHVLQLDGIADGDVVRLAWVELREDEQTRVRVATVPDGEPITLDAGGGLADGVRWLRDPDGTLRLAVVMAGGGLELVDVKGKRRALLSSDDVQP